MNDYPMPEHHGAPPIQMVSTAFGQSEPTTQSSPTQDRTSSSTAPVPGVWWMLSACLIALVAVAGQGTSLFGLIRANTDLAKLEASTEFRQQYSEEVEQLRATRASLRVEIARLKTTHEDIGEQLASENARLHQQAEEVSKHAVILARLASAEDEIPIVEAKLTTRHGQFEALQTKYNDLQREVLDRQKTVDSTRQTLTQLEQAIADRRKELGAVDSDINTLRDQHANAHRDVLKLQQDASTLKAAAERLTNEKSALQGDITIAQATLQQMKEDIAAGDVRLKALNESLATAVAGTQERQVQLSALADQETTIRQTIAALTSERDTLTASIATLTASKQELGAAVTGYEGQIVDLQQDKDLLEQALTQLNGQHRIREDDLQKKQSTLDDITARLDVARRDESSLMKRIDDLTATLRRRSALVVESDVDVPATPRAEDETLEDKPHENQVPDAASERSESEAVSSETSDN